MAKILQPEEIALKYVKGRHDYLTDNEEKKQMQNDIKALLSQQKARFLEAIKGSSDLDELRSFVEENFG